MIGAAMGLMGGGGAGMIDKVMQAVQQMKSQQGGESGQCSEGGKNDPAQMFQQIMQQLTQQG
jgi:hypothetical protein